MERIGAWLDDPNGPSLLLLRGDPGTGKSSVLLNVLQSDRARDVIASVSQAPGITGGFDALALIGSIVSGLTDRGIETGESMRIPVPTEVNINLNVGSVSDSASVTAAALSFSTAGGALPVAERLVRRVLPDSHAVIVIDALDQAEDELADEFLSVVAAVHRAAVGTGVRILCSSRRPLPLAFDDRHATGFDLIADAPPDEDDLGAYLRQRFAFLDQASRDRVVDAIRGGAKQNWLWAATNADFLESEFAGGAQVPPSIPLTSGLEGLYRDGMRRIRLRLGQRWESRARPIVMALACAFDQHLSVDELRWITEGTTEEIDETAIACEPFVRRTPDGLRLFHPDFSRWLVSGNVTGLSEESGHLLVARGLSAMGRENGWPEQAADAAARVIDHWCAVLVLDPFSPSYSEHEAALQEVLTDPSWVKRTSVGLDAVQQAGQVAPGLRFPGSGVSLATGIAILGDAPSAQLLLGSRLSRGLDQEAIDEFDSLRPTPALAFRWLSEQIPDLSSASLQILWGGALAGNFAFERVNGRLQAFLTAEWVLAAPTSDDQDRELLLAELLGHVAPSALGAVIDGLESVTAGDRDGSPLQTWLLGVAYRERARRSDDQDERASDHRRALAAFRRALGATPPDARSRLVYLIDTANELLKIQEPTRAELDELVELEREVIETRRAAGNDDWSHSARLLGQVYLDRAQLGDGAEADTDREAALETFRSALTAAGPDGEARLGIAITLGNALMSLDERTEQQIDELIELHTEIVEGLRRRGLNDWPAVMRLLGHAYLERAEQFGDRGDDYRTALKAYRTALAGAPRDDRRSFAIPLANALLHLEDATDVELDELVHVQTEILETERRDPSPNHPTAAKLLGDAYATRAERRADRDAADADRRRAADAYREAVAVTPAEDEVRPVFLSLIADTLLALDERTAEEIEELIDLARELLASDLGPKTAIVANVLGDALAERGESQGDPAAAEADARQALEAYRQALQSGADDAERRLGFMFSAANALMTLPRRTDAELSELIDLEIRIIDEQRRVGDEDWTASEMVLASAYGERSELQAAADDGDRDKRLGLEAWRRALEGTPPATERRLEIAVRMSAALTALDERTDDEIEELLGLQREVFSAGRDVAGVPWPRLAQTLGTAYRERAGRREGAEREDDLRAALDVFRLALAASPASSAERSDLMIEVANTLLGLAQRTAVELDALITAQSAILAEQRALAVEHWPIAAKLLGDAYRERAARDERTEDRIEALAAYRLALSGTSPDDDFRMVCTIEVANALIALKRRTDVETDELITLQREILDHRRAAGDARWPRVANVLGDIYMTRAAQREDERAREHDLERALDAYREALAATPPDSEERLTFAVDVANTMVVHAAVGRHGSRAIMQEATALVADALAAGKGDPVATSRLLPMLNAALQRHGRNT
jgi:tetratricopeptide (TPR) repeat protein